MKVPRGKPTLERRVCVGRWNLKNERSSRALRREGSLGVVDIAGLEVRAVAEGRGRRALAPSRERSENRTVLTLTSFHSGELEILDDGGLRVRLPHTAAH